MSHWHVAKRRDANAKEIIDGLRAAGRSVTDLGAVGKGVPDLLVGYQLRTTLLEVKNAKTKTVGGESMNKTRVRQAEFRERWRGSPVYVVETLAQALVATEAL